MCKFLLFAKRCKYISKRKKELSIKRAERTIEMGHHSVAEHCWITLTIEDAPKIFAIVLNNLGFYATSEKSARFKSIALDKVAYDETNTEIILDKLSKQDCQLYMKWLEIFKQKIVEIYGSKYPKWFTQDTKSLDSKGIEKTVTGKVTRLAQENARYIISSFMPTSFAYSLPFRQLNYIYIMIKNEIENPSNIIYKNLKNTFEDFINQLEKSGLIIPNSFNDVKDRKLNLIGNGYVPKEYFGDVYATTYKATVPCFGQLQRHRTIDYYFNLPKKLEFYVPKMIQDDAKLRKEWQADCLKQKDKFPQSMLLDVIEMGNMSNFIFKLKERLCTCAQLEINDVSIATLTKYIRELEISKHPLAKELKKYLKGSRCLNGYVCKNSCGFPEGIKGVNRLV